MCEVATIGLALSAVSAVGNFISKGAEQYQYAKYQELQSQAAIDNYIEQTKAINNRYAEEQEATARQKEDVYYQNLQKKATAQTSAATSGIQGNSINTLFAGYDRATAVNNYVAARNLQLKGLQYNEELDSMRIQAINAVNMQQPYTGGSASSTLMSGVGGLLTDYAKTDTNMKFNLFSGRGKKIKTGTRISYSHDVGGQFA